MRITAYLLLTCVSVGTASASWLPWAQGTLQDHFPAEPYAKTSPGRFCTMSEEDWARRFVSDRQADDAHALAPYLNAWGRLMLQDAQQSFGRYGWSPYTKSVDKKTDLDPAEIIDSFAQYGKRATAQEDARIADRLTDQQKYRSRYRSEAWEKPTDNRRYPTLRDMYHDLYHRVHMPKMRAAAMALSELKDAAYRYYLDEQAAASHASR